jgi:uncharacterized protein YndB with AHSA1/START domain
VATTEPAAETGLFESEIHIDAPPDVVFPYLIDPDLFVRWGGTKAELDPRPGGIYRTEIISGSTARGEFVEVDPPRRLVYTFGWESDEMPIKPGGSRVQIDLEPVDGGTRLHVRHTGIPAAAVGQHREGWEHYFGRLAVIAGGGDPGRDPWLDGGATAP